MKVASLWLLGIVSNVTQLFSGNFYASTQCSVAGGIMVFVLFIRVFVCVSGNIVNTISCRVFDTFSPNLHQ